MKPTIGRIVHWQAVRESAEDWVENGKIYPGIITEVHWGPHLVCDVELVFFSSFYGACTSGRVPFSETPKKGHAYWPPREE